MKRNVLFFYVLLIMSIVVKAQTIKVKPYLQDATPESILISWETTDGTESVVEWGQTNSLGNTSSGISINASNGTAKVHEVSLTALQPNTKYYYRVKTGSAISENYHFKTPPTASSEAPFRFIAVSDMQNDASNPNIFNQICHQGILDYMSSNYGSELTDNLALLLVTGDLVMSGTTYSQYKDTYFDPGDGLFQYVPQYPVLGNHEINSVNYFNYFHLPENGPVNHIEHTWYKDYANVRFIGLDSNFEVANYQTQAQLDWLTATLNDASSNAAIDFVVLQIHHPYQSELWTEGEVAYTAQVIGRMHQFTTNSGKPSLHLFGHTHGYSRGQLRDSKHIMIDVATAGGNIDYWGEYSNADYIEFTKSQDEWGFVLFEVTAGDNPKIHVKRVSRGNENVAKNNVITDEFTVYKNPQIVHKPTPVYPVNQTVIVECVKLKATDFSSPVSGASHGQTHWQLSTDPNIGDAEFESWKNFENWFYTVNTQATDDLTDESFPNLQPNTTYYWRVRYRDKEFNWSDWSDIVSFTTGTSAYSPNLVQNPGAESGLANWTIEEGSVEALTNGECGGIAPYAGLKYFAVGGLCTDSPLGRCSQMINVSAYATLIDAGNYQAYFGAYMRDWSGDDVPQIKIYFYNSSNVEIGSSAWLSTTNTSWTLMAQWINIPTTTRSIKVELKGVRNAGADNDSYMDNVMVKLGTESLDCENLTVGSVFEKQLFKLFPNPTESVVFIEYESLKYGQDFQIQITDISGKYISVPMQSQGATLQLNVAQLANGVYFVQVKNKNISLGSQKLMIHR